MAKPIPATPPAYGQDARRIREEMSADRPASEAQIEHNRRALEVAKTMFRDLSKPLARKVPPAR
ncbi:hypothetical protein [Gemmatimonas aurantiaca]|uniref:hypothetical protein n=1 Tax=Gemmatimonas aurantiaca TaxID=173480 RepID=UPI00301C62EC